MKKYGKYAGIFIFNLKYMEQLHPASMNCVSLKLMLGSCEKDENALTKTPSIFSVQSINSLTADSKTIFLSVDVVILKSDKKQI